MIGVHKDGENETVCFMIEKLNDVADISYIKAVNGFLQDKETCADQDVLSLMFDVVNKIIDILVKVLQDNPLMFKFLSEKITELFPYRSIETRYIKYFMKNLLALTEKFKLLSDFSIKTCIEKLVEIECEGDLDKLDQLLYIFLGFLQRNYSNDLFMQVMSVFKSHILKTYQTHYIQHIIPIICPYNQENSELFLSLLIKEVYSGNNVNLATGYIISFLNIYSDLTIICMKYLIYYCLKNIKKKTGLINVKHILKYILFMITIKPELLQEPKINEKIQKLLKHPYNLLKDLPLQEGSDYSNILSLSNYCGDLCFTSIFLPFHCEVADLKLSSMYFISTQIYFNHKRRRRCMSIDIPQELQVKRRSCSIDETKFFDKADCASSITTVTSYQY